MTSIDSGLEMATNILNIKSVSVWWCLYVSSNTEATFEAQFIKKLSNAEAELKKSVAYVKKSVCITYAEFTILQLSNFMKSDQSAVKLCRRLFLHITEKNVP